MSKPVPPNDEAEAEFGYYIRRYEQESVGLGDRLWSEIQAAISLISDHPAIGEVVQRVRVPEKVRRVPLAIFHSYSSTASFQPTSKWSHLRIPVASNGTGVID